MPGGPLLVMFITIVQLIIIHPLHIAYSSGLRYQPNDYVGGVIGYYAASANTRVHIFIMICP